MLQLLHVVLRVLFSCACAAISSASGVFSSIDVNCVSLTQSHSELLINVSPLQIIFAKLFYFDCIVLSA